MKSLPLMRRLAGNLLRGTAVCPSCWHKFPPDDVLWIAANKKLADEPVLPASALTREQRRFIPDRFDVDGRALDAEGTACTQIACPRCRLHIPRPSLELPSFVLSTVGNAGSGKSVFLASMIFALRRHAVSLGLRFVDADLVLNKPLLEDEARLFLDADSAEFRTIKNAVKKTEVENDPRFRATTIEGRELMFVPPYAFVVGPAAQHPLAAEASALSRLLCLYDNAGEHFSPGADGEPATRHMAASKGLIFAFDPTQYPRMQRALGKSLKRGVSVERQDAVLLNAGNRIREHASLSSTGNVPPLVVAVTKFDLWHPLLNISEDELRKMKFVRSLPDTNVKALYLDAVELISQRCRAVLEKYASEVVSAAESISNEVLYVPVAALGWKVTVDEYSGETHFSTADAEPFGVLVPILYLLHRGGSKFVLSARRKTS